MIPRGTTIPCKKKNTFSTYSDNQPKCTIKILEGERKRSRDNNVLGSFDLEGIPPMPRGMPQIEITYDMNADGILNVSATVSGSSGVSKSLTITNDKNKLSAEEIEKMISEAEKYKEEDEKFQKQRDAFNLYESLLYTQKSNIPDTKDEKVELVKNKIQEELQWLQFNSNASIEEIQDRQNKFQEFIKENSFEPPQPEGASNTAPEEPVVEEID
jgi:L1 cell adhesion molecule like protein